MVFHQISKECYAWLEKQSNVKEESLTDWILYAVSQETDRFYYKEFTRNEEAGNGADWEWWVLTNGCRGPYAYRFLVQAKKLKKNQDNYPLISYGNRNGLQIDLLIDSAKRRNAMPIYMYYSVSVPNIMQQIKNFSFIDQQIVAWCKGCINGAYMSMARTVKDVIFNSPRRKVSEVELLNYSLGFSMCDLLLSSQNSAEIIMEQINQYYIKNMADDHSTAVNGIKHFGDFIPGYLKTFINERGNQLDWYESEFRRDFNDIAGIAIIDLTKG